MITKDQNTYAVVNTPIMFHSVTKQGSDTGEIPTDATYKWHVVKTSSRVPADSNFTGETLTYTFPTWGQYHVSVVGSSVHANTEFVGELLINAECT